MTFSGCFTGQRPTLSDPPIGGITGSATGDAATDAVLQWLETTQRGPFTVRYDTLRKLGDVVSVALVTEDGIERRASTVGDVRFLSNQGYLKTCSISTATCEVGTLEERVSDSGFTSQLDAAAPARRLRIAHSRAIGPTVGRTETIGGLTATCVDVPLTTTVIETYCALQNGVVARWDTADIHLELTSFEPVVAEAEFATVP